MSYESDLFDMAKDDMARRELAVMRARQRWADRIILAKYQQESAEVYDMLRREVRDNG